MHFKQKLTNEDSIESEENYNFVVRTQQKTTTVDISCSHSNSFWFSGSYWPFKGMFFPGDPAIIRIWQAIRIWRVANIIVIVNESIGKANLKPYEF
jgi:hypothetical protein